METVEIGERIFSNNEGRQIIKRIIACLEENRLTIAQAEYFLDAAKSQIKNTKVSLNVQ